MMPKRIIALAIFIILIVGLNRFYRWHGQQEDYAQMAEVGVKTVMWDAQVMCNSLKEHVRTHDVVAITNVIADCLSGTRTLVSVFVEDSDGVLVVAYFRDASVWVKQTSNAEWGAANILTVRLKIGDELLHEGWLTAQFYLNSGFDYDFSEEKMSIISKWRDSLLSLNTNRTENVWGVDSGDKVKHVPKGYFVFRGSTGTL